MSQDLLQRNHKIREVAEWCEQQRRSNHYRDVSHLISDRLLATSDQVETEALTAELVSEYQMQGRDDKAEQLATAWLFHNPNDVRARIRLATHYINYGGNKDKIENALTEALIAANNAGKFVREVLGLRARLALKKGNTQDFRQAIEEIVRLGYKPGEIDIPVEADLLSKCPSDYLPNDVSEAYRSLYESSRQQQSR